MGLVWLPPCFSFLLEVLIFLKKQVRYDAFFFIKIRKKRRRFSVLSCCSGPSRCKKKNRKDNLSQPLTRAGQSRWSHAPLRQPYRVRPRLWAGIAPGTGLTKNQID